MNMMMSERKEQKIMKKPFEVAMDERRSLLEGGVM